MDILAKHSKGKILQNDGLALAAEAKKAKLKDPNIINSTIGTLYDENNQFYSFKTIDNIIKNLSDDDFYAYSASSGTNEFYEAVTDWIFEDEKKYILNNMYCKAIPTPGGTGAVSNSIYNALDMGETLLLPNIYWKPYLDMANSNGFIVEEYPFIRNNKFNLTDFIMYCDRIIAKQGKVVTILNDPCNNPTGYSLANDEFLEIIDYMNSRPNALFNVVLDIAYCDYSIFDRKESRQKFSLLTKANDNILFNIAFSCSKTFSIYGLRVGAQVIVSKSQEMVKEVYESTKFLARTRWSNVSKAGISLLTILYKNSDLKNKVIDELNGAITLVNERAQLFVSEAKNKGLYMYPFCGGFFITVIYSNPELLANELKIRGVFVLAVSTGVRIAICSLSKNEITRIVNIIKLTIDDISY